MLSMVGAILYFQIHELSFRDKDTDRKLKKYAVTQSRRPECMTWTLTWKVRSSDKGVVFDFFCPKCGDVSEKVRELL
jgi:predicted RNA-binding Zn-ribbon protein involved in translation (DUF1610 family)